MNDTVTHKYHGVTIEYRERENDWFFTVRGRERTAESLAKAKESIDRPDPKEKIFEPIACYHRSYGGSRYTPGRITSTAISSYYAAGSQAWFVSDATPPRKSKREKVMLSNCFARTPETEKTMREYERLDALKDKLAGEMRDLEDGLNPVTLPKVGV